MKLLYALFCAVFVCSPLMAGELTISGRGQTSAAADVAYVSVAVVAESKNPADALKRNAAAMDNLFRTLEALKIAKKDMQTSYFGLTPKYRYIKETNEQEMIGYTATHQLNITICDIKQTGEVLDALVKDGANRISGISFGLSQEKQEALTKEARELSMKDALAKAQLYANGLNVKLTGIKSIHVGESSAPRMEYARAAAMSADTVPGSSVEGGSIRVTSVVNVVWETNSK